MNLLKNKYKWKLSERQFYYFVYTILFAAAALIVFSWYFLNGNTLVWTVDGWGQHYKALVYYAEYVRSIIKSLLFQHEFVIPRFDFSIGEGNDILQTLHYYVIGDPFSVCSAFIPTRFMYLYYTAAVLFRLYLSGMAFSALCFQTGSQSRYAVLSGAMAYVFCYWGIVQAGQHPFFLNPMLYLPLLIMGVEKIIKGKRPYLFILVVAISAMSNFYFFYVLVGIMIVYVLIRLLLLYYKNIRQMAILLIRIGAASLLGLLLSAVIFLPMCYAFLIDARGFADQTLSFIYPLSYYAALPAAFLTTEVSYQLYMGFAAPILPAVLLLFCKRKQYTFLKILFTACVIVLAFPFLGQALNGFSYISNRWCFAFALVTSYILTIMFPFLLDLKQKEAAFLTLGIGVYFFICMLSEYSRTKQVFAAIVLCMLLLFILLPTFDVYSLFPAKRKQQFILLTVLVSVFLTSFWKNSVSEGDDARGMGRYIANMLTSNETAAVSMAAKLDKTDEFYRYSGRDLTANANMAAGISSTQYYWTLSNPKVSEYRSRLNLVENTAFRYTGYDDRTALNSLATVLYYSVSADDPAAAPYGFTHIDEEELPSMYRIYRNDNALPISYTYHSYILEDAWDALSSVDKQNAMLQSVVLAKGSQSAEEGKPVLNSKDIAYTITCNGNGVTQQGNSFVVTSENSSITITFDGTLDSETYLEIAGLDFQSSSKYELYFGNQKFDPLNLYDQEHWDWLSKSSRTLIKRERWFLEPPTYVDLTVKAGDHVSKELRYYTREHSYYANRHDFTVNMGYSEDALSQIKIQFSDRGIYSFDSIHVFCQPMGLYEEQIETLKKDTMQSVVMGTDTVSGEITLDSPGILCFSIPYSAGWRAYVDGKEKELLQANIMHMALDLDAGTHIIELTYETPLLKEGIWLSLCGICIFLTYLVFNERKYRKEKVL